MYIVVQNERSVLIISLRPFSCFICSLEEANYYVDTAFSNAITTTNLNNTGGCHFKILSVNLY